MRGMVNDGTVYAFRAITVGVTSLVSWTEFLAAICMACISRWAYAHGEGAVSGGLPATLLAIRLA